MQDGTQKISLLKRARRLFNSRRDRDEAAAPPAQPMSDRDLARAIRAFQKIPVPEWTAQKLGKGFNG